METQKLSETKDSFAKITSGISVIISVIALCVSTYFAIKQNQLAEKVFVQSQENIKLSMLLDYGGPVRFEPPHQAEQAGAPGIKWSIPPTITLRYKTLLSNTSSVPVTIKHYQIGCVKPDGMVGFSFDKPLNTQDGTTLKSGSSIDPGRSLTTFTQVTCDISPNAYNILRQNSPHTLSEANSILAKYNIDLFGQAPEIENMPDGLQVQKFRSGGTPEISVTIFTISGKTFSERVPWNGNDIF